MPVINFSYKDAQKLLGEDIPADRFLEEIPLMGSDIGDNIPGRDEMSVEFFPNRPDMYSVEGIARGMRAFLGIEPGLKTYPVDDSDVKAVISEDVKGVRPYLACAVIKDVEVDDAMIKSMMEMQEKLHLTVGRKRSKFAIGIHDLDKVVPPFTYKTVDPDGIRFVPLAMEEEMTPREILERNPKGKEFAHLVEGMPRYPIILDSEGQVLSFPPIINGVLTTVTTESRNLFVEVTGNDADAVESVVNIVASSLAERGGRICSVEVDGAPKDHYPDLGSRSRTVSLEACRRFVGIEMTPDEAVGCLNRMGMGAEVSGDGLTAHIPAWRMDIMHDVDIFEDVAIGYGFERYGRDKSVVTQTFGSLLPETEFSESLKDVMVGLGYTEVTTLTLSNHRDEFELSGFPEVDAVCVKNPITEDHTSLRSYLMPSLMRILRHNKHRDLPQRIFEVGFVIRNGKNVLHLCAVQAASRSSFTEVKSLTESILGEMGVEYSLDPCDYPTFVPGRGASIMVDGESIGVFGEMSPSTIVGYEMTHPVTVVEMDISGIISSKSRGLLD